MTTFGENDVVVVSKETAYQGYFRIDRYLLKHRTFAGGWTPPVGREVFERGHAVSVLLYDPVRDEVALIEQFRVGALAAGWQPWLIEVVAGIIDEGESTDEVARRETLEEAGCEVLDLAKIGDFILSPGAMSETVRMYCARVDCSVLGGLHGLAHEAEDIRLFTVPTDEAIRMVKDGRINNGAAVISLLWLAGERENLKKSWGVCG